MLATGSVAMATASLYYATFAVRSQWWGPTYWRGRTDTNSVALTFDDGPSPDTERILDALGAHEASATFFMVGREVESLPGIAQRVLAEGHEVGNHSYSHSSFLYQRGSKTREQIQRAQEAIAETVGVIPRLARPPYGVRTPAYFRAARALDLQTVQWDVAGFDWKRITPRQISDNVLRKARPGSIILLHDGDGDGAGKNTRKNTAEALPLMIRGLRDRDLQVSPLSQLLRRALQPEQPD